MADGERAEERAEEELELKRQTLQLERDKFKYGKVSAFRDRTGVVLFEASKSLLLANASGLFVFTAYYKSLIDNIGRDAFGYSIWLFVIGTIAGVVTYIDAVTLRMGSVEFTEKEAKSASWNVVTFGIFSMFSMVCFLSALCVTASHLYSLDEIGSHLSQYIEGLKPKPKL